MNAKRLTIALVSVAFSETVNKLFPLLIIRYAHQTMGLEAFGYAAYGVYLVDLALPLVGFGYLLKGSLQASHDEAGNNSRPALIGQLIAIRLLHTLVVSILAFAVLQTSPELKPYQPLVLALSFVWVVNALELSFLYYADQRLAWLSYYNIGIKTISLASVFFFVQDSGDAILYALLTYGTNAIVPLITFFAGVKKYGIVLPQLTSLAPFFIGALPHGVATFLSGWYDRLDLYMVEHFEDAVSLGRYAGAIKVYQSLLPLFFVLNSVFFSELLGARGNLAAFQKLLRHSLQFNLAVTIPMAVGIWFVAADLLRLLIGDSFAEYSHVLAILVTGLIFHCLIAVLTQQVLSILDRLKIVAFSFAMGLLVGVVSGYGLTLSYGVTGAAVSVVVAKFVTMGLMLFFSRNHIPLAAGGDFLKILPPTALMLGFLLISQGRLHWIAMVIFAVILYFGASALINRELIRLALQKLVAKTP